MIARTQQPDLTSLSPRSRQRLHGFTLIEVILAIIIATGILIVALYFYNQSARLRTDLIQQSEKLSAVRLLMERITADIRTARADAPAAFIGDSSWMHFAHADVPSVAFRAPTSGRIQGAESDLRWISYSTQSSREGTNSVVRGITRIEEPLLDGRRLEALSATNSAVLGTDTVSTNRPPEPLTEDIHFLRFSYWDGQAWADVWKNVELPEGVEVSLGLDALPEGTDPIDYPFELFRRTIHLPAGGLARRAVAQASIPGGPP